MKRLALLTWLAAFLFLGINVAGGTTVALVSGDLRPELRIIAANETGILLQFELPNFEAEPVTENGTLYHRLSFMGSNIGGEIGKPDLPVLRKLIWLPDQAGWRYEVNEADYVELSGYKPAPLADEEVESADGITPPAFVCDAAAYQQDRWIPETPVALGGVAIMRDYRIATLELRPLQYNPAQGLLRVYRRLTVQIYFDGEAENPIVQPRLTKSRVYSNLISQNVINPPIRDLDEEVLGGYLFITPSNYQSTLQSQLVEWKKEKGFPCTVMTTTQAGGTAQAIKNTIQGIYNTWPVPPDFLVLVSDVDNGMPAFYYDGLVTDLPYTLLEGSDYLPDMLVGRLSVDSESELAVVCTKTRSYEKDPYTSAMTWFTKALLVYDYSGSASCKPTKERCGDLMAAQGYTIERVTNPPYYSGASYINPIINNGVTFVNYRGYGTYSGWTPPNYYSSNIAQLSNDFKLPVITSIVCGGGNFASSTDPCFGEAWIRYGTVSSPKGGVAFVGPSSLYTHTRWNNCLDGGIYQGIFMEGIGDFGSAVLRGKMELYTNFPNNLGPGGTTNSVECYFHTYNILGDPGLEMWTGLPATPTVSHPTSLAQGTNSFTLSITTDSPVQDALVCVYNAAADYQRTGWTGSNGGLQLALDGAPAGSYTVTVTKHGLITYHSALTISQQSVALGIANITVDDDSIGESSGDGDGQVNPGEIIELAVSLINSGSSQPATGVTGVLSTSDPYLSITQNSLTGPDLAPGASGSLIDDFNLLISPEAPHGHTLQALLMANSAQGSWGNLVNLPVVAPLAEFVRTSVQNGSGYLAPGETANVLINIKNSGGDPLTNASGTLISLDPRVTVMDGSGSWSTLAPGSGAYNSGDPFALHAAFGCPPGWKSDLQLIVVSGIYADTLTFEFTVGQTRATDPAGPDEYGYRCFDSRDLQYLEIPTYNWIEASTQPGQVTLSLPDYGEEQDAVTTQNLPFNFMFYGQSSNRVSICSNGWICMGETWYSNARNWNIPGALGPPNMIAPFWDDLRMDGASAHFWHDAANHRVVIEWKDVHTHFGWGLNRFEVILNDPAYYPTPTGDGEIIFQYHTFNNVDGSENYCTVGIQDPTHEIGVVVTYANHNSAGSATLAGGVALKFTTAITYAPIPPNVQVALVPYGAPIQIPATGGSFSYNISLTNYETTPSPCTVWCDVLRPSGGIYGPTLGPVNVTINPSFTINRDRNFNVAGNWPAGSYAYNAYVGSYPSAIWDSTSFPFEKLPSGVGIWVENSYDWGEPLDQDLPPSTRENVIPQQFSLEPAYPNPFNPTTLLRLNLPTARSVALEVYNPSGRLVQEQRLGYLAPGAYELLFDGTQLPSGVYFYRLLAEPDVISGKMVLMK